MTGELAASTDVSAETFMAEVQGMLSMVRGGLEGWRATRETDSVSTYRAGVNGFRFACSTMEQIIDRAKLHRGLELRLTVGPDAELNGRPGLPTYSFRKESYDMIRVARTHRLLRPGDTLPILVAHETMEREVDDMYVGKFGCMVSMKELAQIGRGATLDIVKLEAHEADLPGTQNAA